MRASLKGQFLAALGAVVFFACCWFWFLPARIEDRVYRIGLGNDPPLHFQDSDGKPSGLAVGLVKEAARRRGIRLEWVRSKNPGIPSLVTDEVDLWVAMTVLPERRQQVFLSEPYLVTEYCFLVRAESPYKSSADLRKARISFADFGIHRQNLAHFFPLATPVPTENPVSSISAMTAGEADAAFVDQFAVSRALTQLTVTAPVRVISVPMPRGYLGLAANYKAAAVAQALRDEIRLMTDDGTIHSQIEGWGFFPLLNLEAINTLSNSKRREQSLIGVLAFVVILLVCTALLVVSLRRDRAQLVRAKAALRDSEEHYRTLVELLPDTIYVLDAQGVLRSSTTTPQSERPTDSLVPHLLTDSVTHRKDVETVLKTGLMTITEKTLGGRLPIEYRLIPLHDSKGAISGVMGILRDQTARQQAEEERSRLEDQLRQSQKMEVVGRLAGGIAHDFNNLLTVINGYSAGLVSELPKNSRAGQQVSKILKAGNAAADLTRQLLTFSRKQPLSPGLRDLNQILASAADMLRSLLGDDVALRTNLAPDLPPILADTGQIEQVLMNLAANARDAMPNGGSFALETSLESLTAEQASQQIGASRGPHVVLSARDTGTGIPADNIPRIFDPFFTTKQDATGTGLGLSIVYGIIRQSGGWITISSELGSGTTFQLHFPAVAGEVARELHAPLATLPEAVAVGTVLLVEDRADVRALVADVLRNSGYTVLEAASPAVGIHHAERHKGTIDALVTDVVMPGMRGPELAKRIQSLRPTVKILFVTGFPGEVNLTKDNLFADATVLAKPFGPETLIATMEELLGSAQRRSM